MLEGKDVDKHPSTQERGVNLRSSTKKQGVDITKYLLLCTLMPSNITFQRWLVLQGRCTPAVPTARIGRLSQPGLWEGPLNFADRVIES